MMNTWLLAWNPNRFPWNGRECGYNELRMEIVQNSVAYYKWTCGVNRSIRKGDRVFLIRLGKEPRGIVASGFADSNVYEGMHWKEDLAAAGKKVHWIQIAFDKIANMDEEEYLPYKTLKEINGSFRWSSQASGIGIPETTAGNVEEAWKSVR